MPLFQWHAVRSSSQAKRTEGLVRIKVFYAGERSFCTLTSWEGKEQMLNFRNSGAHRMAMILSAKMGEGSTTSWESNNEATKEFGELRLSRSTIGLNARINNS